MVKNGMKNDKLYANNFITPNGDLDAKISNASKSVIMVTSEQFIGSSKAKIETILYENEGYLTKALNGTKNNQNGKLYYYFKIPNDFGSIDSSNVVNIYTMLSNSLKPFTLTMYKNGVADSVINAVNISPSSDNVMTKFTFVPGSTYLYEDDIMFVLDAVDIDKNESFEVQHLVFNYNKKTI